MEKNTKILAKSSPPEELWEHTCKALERLEKLAKTYDIKEKELIRLVITVLFHDLGKINYVFQKKIIKKIKGLEENPSNEKLCCDKWREEIKHEILSVVWVDLFKKYLKEVFNLKDEDINNIKYSILYHHHRDSTYLEDPEEFLIELLNEIEDYHLWAKDNWREYFYEGVLKKIIGKNKNGKVFEIVRNLGEELYKLEETEYDYNDPPNSIFGKGGNANSSLSVYPLEEDYLEEFRNVKVVGNSKDMFNNNEILEFIYNLGCLRRCDYSASGYTEIETGRNKDVNIEIKDKEGKKEIDLWQKELIEKVKNEIIDKKIIIITAPTGSGKTELSLLLTKELDPNKKKKIFYVLPIRVSLNDLYSRIFENYLDKDETEVGLLHSTAFTEYLERDKEGLEGYLLAKSLAPRIILTTADQVLLTSLLYYGFDKIACLYKNSIMIIDEIQSYSEEMTAAILRSMKLAKEMGAKIIIMTATLPAHLRKIINEELGGSQSELINIEVGDKVDKNKIKNYSKKRHRIEVRNKKYLIEKEPNEEVIKELEKHLEKGKKVIVLLNTVKKAVLFYEKLKDKLGEKKGKIHLLHSRILNKKKKEKVEKLKGEKEGYIVVATQVIEASIDLDADILYTEISPLESQIQRWGRIFRNRKEEFEGGKNIFIFKSSEKSIYDEQSKSLSLRQLQNLENEILDYMKEKGIIEKDYGEETKNIIAKIKKEIDYQNTIGYIPKEKFKYILNRVGGKSLVILDLLKEDQEYKKENSELKEWIKKLEESRGKITLREMFEEEDKKEKEKKKYLLMKKFLEYSIDIPFYFNLDKEKFKVFEWNGLELLYEIKLDKKSKEKVLSEIEELGYIGFSEKKVNKDGYEEYLI